MLGSVSVGSSCAEPNSRAACSPTLATTEVLGAGEPRATVCLPLLLLGEGTGGVLVDNGLTGLLGGGVGRGLTPDALAALLALAAVLDSSCSVLPAPVVVPDNSCRT